MISIPIAVHTNLFKWQLGLFWHNHRLTYNTEAYNKAYAVIINKHRPNDNKIKFLQWDMDIPHQMCDSFYDILTCIEPHPNNVPLNMQVGLEQILHNFADDQIIELLDCDMFHIRQHPDMNIENDCLYVDDFYEEWHVKSLTTNRAIIEKYFLNDGKYYNGGFVPIIGRISTFRKLLREWIDIHIDISKDYSGNKAEATQIRWWAGMFSLQAACERKKIKMISKNLCYFPGINALAPEHYIVHYSCDRNFRKKDYPNIDISKFPNDIFYDRLRSWPNFCV